MTQSTLRAARSRAPAERTATAVAPPSQTRVVSDAAVSALSPPVPPPRAAPASAAAAPVLIEAISAVRAPPVIPPRPSYPTPAAEAAVKTWNNILAKSGVERAHFQDPEVAPALAAVVDTRLNLVRSLALAVAGLSRFLSLQRDHPLSLTTRLKVFHATPRESSYVLLTRPANLSSLLSVWKGWTPVRLMLLVRCVTFP